MLFPLGSVKFKTAHAEEKAAISTIAGIEVGNLTENEIRGKLTDAIDRWMNEPLLISGGESEIVLNPAIIHHDIDSTIDLYNSIVKRLVCFWEKESVVHIPLEILPSEELKTEISKVNIWDLEETYTQVMNTAGYLKAGKIEAVVEDTTALEANRIALAIEEIPETAFGTYDIAHALNDQVIAPGETFSFIQALGENIDAANSEALNFTASLVYQSVLNINSEILERHSQQKVPDYSEPGIEAAINRNGEDLQFINRLTTPIKLKLSVDSAAAKGGSLHNAAGSRCNDKSCERGRN